ncbi:MAG: helix-turn-helix transcriptional regulator [Candidatus Nitrospinota bacterium M3_3B_026]
MKNQLTRKGDVESRLLTEKEAADHLQLSVKTMQRWRYLCSGPRYLKLNGSIRYRLSDLDEWVGANVCDTTDTENIA